ncbi:MAG: thioredoxin family protein [Saprospiraceae bacterium]|jgi:thioredoxin-related protein
MRRLLVLVFLLSSYFVAGQVKSPVISSDKTVADAKKRSSSEGKLLFIFFYADWVQLCQWMKTSTFTDPDLARFLNENALFLELNIETSIGNAEKQAFNVKALPTMILFDASGNQLERIDEAMNATKLLSKLNTWNLKENKQVQTGNVSDKSANQSLQHLTKAALLPSQANVAENSEANYFGIAIKYFHQHDQALQYMQQFQGRVEKRVSVVSREISTGLYQYQIIVSKFSSMEEARAYLPKLRMLNISGEIIKF